MVRATVVTLLLFSTVSFAEEAAADAPTRVEPRGIFVGDRWRHPQLRGWKGLGLRTLADLAAIPAGVVNWDATDATLAALTTLTTVALVMPLQPSLDVRLQSEIQQKLGDDHPQVWNAYTDAVIWITLWSGLATSLFYGLAAEDDSWIEVASLATEAVLVAQLYTNLIKFLTGREGPLDGNGQGEFHGPTAYTRLFPAGIPSGHMASMYALFSVAMYYFNEPIVWLVLNAVGLLAAATMVMDNYHWASDNLLGAAIGFVVGRWVVMHRSSRYQYRDDGFVERVMGRVTIVPAILPGNAYGVAAGFSF